MKKQSYHDTFKLLGKEINTLCTEYGLKEDRAFAVWCLREVHNLSEDDAVDQTDTLSRGDGGNDGWIRDDENQIFHIWQCKWTKNLKKTFDTKPFHEVLFAFIRMLDPEQAKEQGEPFRRAAVSFRKAVERGYTVQLSVGLSTQLSESAEKKIEKLLAWFKSLLQKKYNKLVVVNENWGVERFESWRENADVEIRTMQGQQVHFALKNKKVMELEDKDLDLPRGWAAAVVSISGKSLGEIGQEYGARLFDLNVRFSLGKNKRITKISDTIRDKKEEVYFWLYNNGITVLCDDFKLALGNNPTLTAWNPRIVNGCQTITTFKNLVMQCSERPAVLARFIKPAESEEGKSKASKIAEYTNNQSPILSRDLKANDPIHLKIQNKLKGITPPYFYERKRGEWKSLTRAKRRMYGGRHYDCDFLGQSIRMVSYPSDAIKKKAELFEKDEVYGAIFDQTKSAEELLYPAILRTQFDDFWNLKHFSKIKELSEYWDEDKFKKLLRARGQVIAHSIALTEKIFAHSDSYELSLKIAMNFAKCWEIWCPSLLLTFGLLMDYAADKNESVKTLLEGDVGGKTALTFLWEKLDGLRRASGNKNWQADLFGKLKEACS